MDCKRERDLLIAACQAGGVHRLSVPIVQSKGANPATGVQLTRVPTATDTGEEKGVRVCTWDVETTV